MLASENVLEALDKLGAEYVLAERVDEAADSNPAIAVILEFEVSSLIAALLIIVLISMG
jgi:hypothetical protein